MALLTPRKMDGERLRLDVSDEDAAKVKRGPGWRATVTDIPTGIRYGIVAAPCKFAGCYCDALVVATTIEGE